MTPPDGDLVIVIGSGPTGAMAAARLVARGVWVTMLDAGTGVARGIVVRVAGNTIYRNRAEDKLEINRHVDAPDEHVDWYSSRSHGGLTNYWTAAVPRFAPEDFTEGAALDERYRWPVTYDELVPHYERAEQALVVTAGRPIANVPANRARHRTTMPKDWRELASKAGAHGFNVGEIPMAKGSPWMLARRGSEFNSYECIVRPMIGGTLFELRSGAQATELHASADGERVEAVSYVDRSSGRVVRLRCRAVVVAAGAIDSTALLLRSRSSAFPNGVGNNGGIVGRYLHDHPRQWWTATPARPMTALSHPVYIARRAYDPASPLLATSLTIGLAHPKDRLRTFVRGAATDIGVQVFGTMIPTPDIGVSVDPGPAEQAVSERPQIRLHYDQAALDNLASAPERLRELFGAVGTTVSIPGPFHDVVPGNSVHYGGTVRMHASPEFGALDGWNQMYEVANVVVCDSSCFTTGAEKNPTLTAMAIAARAADHLADELARTESRF